MCPSDGQETSRMAQVLIMSWLGEDKGKVSQEHNSTAVAEETLPSVGSSVGAWRGEAHTGQEETKGKGSQPSMSAEQAISNVCRDK